MLVAVSLFAGAACGEDIRSFNADESKVPPYSLPELMVKLDGTEVRDVTTWQERRKEIIRLFEDNVYGRSPGAPANMKIVAGKVYKEFLNNKATLKEVQIVVSDSPHAPQIHVLIIVPNARVKPVPAFAALNFNGNHSIHPDPAISLSTAWMRPNAEGQVNNRATEASRGKYESRWPIELIISRGYALITAYYGDLDPDFDDGFKNGVQPFFYKEGQTRPAPDEWAALAAWSWGLMRIMDYVQSDADIDARRVAAVGHSRLGKAALWASAMDERIAIAISNNSGKGGASLWRRQYGESILRANTLEPHRFCANFTRFSKAPETLPVDAHMLLAMIAPRPVYVASATEDHLADPKGEFLAAKAAEPVYALYNLAGLNADAIPQPDTPIGSHIGYHLRTGKHALTEYDWKQFLNFADRHFSTKR